MNAAASPRRRCDDGRTTKPGSRHVRYARRAAPARVRSRPRPGGAAPAALARRNWSNWVPTRTPTARRRPRAWRLLDQLHALHRYPDPLGADLKRALAAKHGVDVAQILLGNGSHELLMQLAQVFAGPGEDVVFSRYGFAVFALATQAAGATARVVEALPREHARDAAGPRPGRDRRGHHAGARKLVYLANPNNPTGTWFGREAFAAFLAQRASRSDRRVRRGLCRDGRCRCRCGERAAAAGAAPQPVADPYLQQGLRPGRAARGLPPRPRPDWWR